VDVLTDPFDGATLEWAALPLRAVLGAVFVVSGGGKFRRGISGTGNWFRGLGLPLPQLSARLVATVELAGGVLLLVGLFVHWVAVPLFLNMLVATWVEKVKLRAPFSGGEMQGYELTVLLAGGSLALVLLGAGPLSIDALIGR
jgi:uncharacterized membrane protein YphA (DoxX/SURF4 family)